MLYFEEHGDSNIGISYVTDTGLRLGTWVSSQRYAYSKGKLPQEQIELLNQIDFSWHRDNSRWEVGFSFLEKYYRLYGNANVPPKYVTAEDFELGRWVSAQRCNYKKAKIDKNALPAWTPLDSAGIPTLPHGRMGIPFSDGLPA